MSGDGQKEEEMTTLLRRAWGAARLDVATYEEVEADRTANGQAFVVVLLSAAGAGIGSIENGGAGGIVWIALASLCGWWIWAWLTYFIGTRLLPGEDTEADHGELLRTIGFSSAPGVLRIFAVLPMIDGFVYAFSTLWMLVAMVVGVRQALDYHSPERGAASGTGRAIAVCAIGFPFYAVFIGVSLLILGPWPV